MCVDIILLRVTIEPWMGLQRPFELQLLRYVPEFLGVGLGDVHYSGM